MVDDYSFTVDLNKPIVFQVGHLGEAYYEWVHQPIIDKECPRFFANDFFELLTRTAWWVVPVVWLPVASWFISNSSRMGLTDHPDQLVLTVVSGIFVWTLVEYILHRFLFHMKTRSYWRNTIHYAIHGYHHKYPKDAMRLVMPPPAAAALSVPRYHLNHHFRIQSKGFGVTSSLWDYVFGTVPSTKAAEKKQN
ncbi:dihydroceramide fatty acyl 2-hydroxylase FAH1-like [Malus domestica]|uniref:dihydroceramide fatty acyl 2-hydroxylase FAH1-like n=1 Tax=Malus domestica TaxID=3750 RepID=UPI003976C83B